MTADETHDLGEQVENLIGAHLAESGGGMATGFHLICEFVDGDGEHSWMYVTAPKQTQSRTLGLIHFARGVAEYELQRYLQETIE